GQPKTFYDRAGGRNKAPLPRWGVRPRFFQQRDRTFGKLRAAEKIRERSPAGRKGVVDPNAGEVVSNRTAPGCPLHPLAAKEGATAANSALHLSGVGRQTKSKANTSAPR